MFLKICRQLILSLSLVFTITSAPSAFASDPAKLINNIQVIEGDLAFAIYTAIRTEEMELRRLCTRSERDCDGNQIIDYTKKAGNLACSRYRSGKGYCFVSDSGLNPGDIKGAQVVRRLYDVLISRPLPLGQITDGQPEGTAKQVAGILCFRSVEHGTFTCNITYRQ